MEFYLYETEIKTFYSLHQRIQPHHLQKKLNE